MANVRVSVRVSGAVSARLYASLNPDLSSPILGPNVAVAKGQFARPSVSGLTPGLVYYLGVGLNGAAPGSALGQFRVPGYSHRMALSSCSNGAATEAYRNVKALAPDFFLHMGDFHYEDINTNNVQLFRDAFRRALSGVNRRALHNSIPTMYIWDDHDYGANNSGATSASRPAAVEFFRERIPTIALADEIPTGGGYRAITVGRVMYLITDQRAYADGPAVSPPRTVLGVTQKTWLKNIIADPANQDKVFMWVCPRGLHINPANAYGDAWTDYPEERTELFDHFSTYASGRMMILNGDTHQAGLDDGTNCNYTTGGAGAGVPILMAGPMASSPWSADSATWSNGLFKNDGQIGVMDVEDDGTDITVTCRVYGATTNILGTMTRTFTPPVGLGYNPGPRPTVSGTRWRLNMRRVMTYCELYEVELRETPAGAQAAIHGTSGTASASSIFSASYPASRAFNGAATGGSGNQWSSAVGTPTEQWLEFEFSSSKTIREIAIIPYTNWYPQLLNFEVHDGTQFKQLIDFGVWSGFPNSYGRVFAIP